MDTELLLPVSDVTFSPGMATYLHTLTHDGRKMRVCHAGNSLLLYLNGQTYRLTAEDLIDALSEVEEARRQLAWEDEGYEKQLARHERRTGAAR